MFAKIKEPEGIIDKVLYGSIALAVMFFMVATLVLPYFASAIEGQSAMVVGILTLALFLSLLGFALAYIPRKR